MQGQPDIRASRSQNPTSDSLSPTTAECPGKHGRSPSAASFGSGLSRITTVEDDWNLVTVNQKSKKGSNSNDIPFKLSRFDCLKGLFLIGKMRRKVAATLPERDADDTEPWKGSPWILPVYALSNRKDKDSHFERKEAQCTIDTGNEQGNIASEDFVFNQLGYTMTDLSPLTDLEQRGGVAASGDKVIPLGAIHLTWYHSRSARVFRDMRFLITSNPRCDLVIGARSIEKHDLLLPPNLVITPHGRTVLKPEILTDPKYQALDSARAQLKNELQSLKGEHDSIDEDDDEDDEKPELLAKITETQKLLDVAELETELYTAEKTLQDETTTENEERVSRVKKDLKGAQAKLPKELEPRLIHSVRTNMSSGSSTSKRSLGSIMSRINLKKK